MESMEWRIDYWPQFARWFVVCVGGEGRTRGPFISDAVAMATARALNAGGTEYLTIKPLTDIELTARK